jgi:hypothetical protein
MSFPINSNGTRWNFQVKQEGIATQEACRQDRGSPCRPDSHHVGVEDEQRLGPHVPYPGRPAEIRQPAFQRIPFPTSSYRLGTLVAIRSASRPGKTISTEGGKRPCSSK